MFSFTDFPMLYSLSRLILALAKIFTIFFFKVTMYLSMLDLCLIFFFCFTVWGCIFNTNFRYKVKYFLGFLFIISIFGFMASFDGCILLLLLTEFFIVLIFFLMYLTSLKFQTSKLPIFFSFNFFLFTTIFVYFFSVTLSLGNFPFQYSAIYESTLDTFSSDFFLFFQFYFVTEPVLVIYCGLILSFFIIFFICFYFQLKQMQIQASKKNDSVEVLRKQNGLKQAKHKAQIRIFKLNVPKR